MQPATMLRLTAERAVPNPKAGAWQCTSHEGTSPAVERRPCLGPSPDVMKCKPCWPALIPVGPCVLL